MYYRPILWVSFFLDAQYAGIDPQPYHAVNLVLHLVTTCLVFELLTRLGHSRALSLFLSAIFCVHPVLVQAVAWIPGRNDSLLALFVLLATLGLLAHLRTRSLASLLLTLASFALALLTKESAVVLCVILPAFVWVRRGARPLTDARLIALAACALVVLIVWAGVRSQVLSGFSLYLDHIPSNLAALIAYVGKTFLPYDLSPGPSQHRASIAIGGVALSVLAGVLWFQRRRWVGILGVGVVWYFGFLLPTLLSPAFTRGLEHRLYVPMIGMLIVLAEIPWPAHRLRGRWPRAVLGLALVACLAGLSAARVPDFANGIRFWERVIENAPDSHWALRILSMRYRAAGRIEDMERTTRRCLEVAPDDSDSRFNLAVILESRGDLQEAASEIEQALRVDAEEAEGWKLLAKIQRKLGRHDEAAASRERFRELQALTD
jgi:Flp pilus assembly protein TadD